MKRILIIFLTVILYGHASATFIRSGDIYFEQDTIDSTKLNITVIFTGILTGPMATDSVYLKFSNAGTGYNIPLYDTVTIQQGLHYKVYKSSYYVSASDSGILTISAVTAKRETFISNIENGNSDFLSICVNLSINVDSIRADANYSSARFKAPPFVYDSTYRVIFYNPLLSFDVRDSVVVELLTPLQDFEVNVPMYQLPNQVSSNVGSDFHIENNTGAMVWDYPTYGGIYCVAFRASCYRNGAFISSIMRDMLLYVAFTSPNSIVSPDREELMVFPSPTKDKLFTGHYSNANAVYSIISQQGAVVLSGGTMPHNIDVSQLPGGIYYLAIYDNLQRYVKKFVKQ